MAGIYIHIPFCKQACHYCNFHFSTNLSNQQSMVDAICKEAFLTRTFLSGALVETIYFGGGTPSLLHAWQFDQIFKALHDHFIISEKAEVTIEANPDDLDEETLEIFRSVGFNRISIGIQSFNDQFLQYLNRPHDSKKALSSVKFAQTIGFDNISVDLIYGIPFDDHRIWENDLSIVKSCNVQHISSYCLTIEDNTAFGKWHRKGQLKVASENFSAEQYEMLSASLSDAGFVHYEISNFAKEGFFSRHNSSYWNNTHYLGLGPGAHSYNGSSRRWNVYNNPAYIKSVTSGIIPFEEESLTEAIKLEEYILTSLRTIWGCDLSMITSKEWVDKNKILSIVQSLTMAGLITLDNQRIYLTLKGKLMADEITTQLFSAF